MVLAIDSWTGDLSMWFSESWREAMAWQDGRSQIYERFLNRVVQKGLTDTILPLRAHSIVGARMLHLLNYTIDAIYLDNAQVCSLGSPSMTALHRMRQHECNQGDLSSSGPSLRNQSHVWG